MGGEGGSGEEDWCCRDEMPQSHQRSEQKGLNQVWDHHAGDEGDRIVRTDYTEQTKVIWTDEEKAGGWIH